MKTILIVEDDKNINEMLQKVLKNAGYNIKSAYSGTEALLLHNDQIDLILLDLMLPGKSGEEIMKELKKIKDVPIIVASAITDMDKKLDLFSLGANDYVTKPFNNEELLARIKVQLKSNWIKEENILKIKDLKLDTINYTVTGKKETVNLSKTEFEILKLLMQNKNQVVTKSMLFDTVWDTLNSADENTLNVHISKIRNKLKKASGSNEYIETVWSIGYIMKN